jgi:hypothetical protein
MSRRRWLKQVSALVGAAGGLGARAGAALDELDETQGRALAAATRDFVIACRRPDGGYAASPDPSYLGESDTKLSDLAAVTYAVVLARTMDWELPDPARSADYILRRQRPDGRFVHLAGGHDPDSDLGILYNTTQGVVALRALGRRPDVDPTPVLHRLLDGDSYQQLPWYTTSFFPLFHAALGTPLPDDSKRKLAAFMERNQAADGYLGDHVAATFHMAHFYRLLGEPTPGADRMVARTIRDQKPDGSWNIKAPDWDVHACFDAIFILRQLAGDNPAAQSAIDRGASWALRCRNPDGGFGHFPGRPSDMDAVYFQFAALIQAGKIPGARLDLADAHTLGWGHAMQPGRIYQNSPLQEA